jgi:hypothetical protein
MGIADIREAFLSGADGYLDVRDVGMRYAKDGRQILQFTGWHRNGTPFAFVSAASLYQRAQLLNLLTRR